MHQCHWAVISPWIAIIMFLVTNWYGLKEWEISLPNLPFKIILTLKLHVEILHIYHMQHNVLVHVVTVVWLSWPNWHVYYYTFFIFTYFQWFSYYNILTELYSRSLECFPPMQFCICFDNISLSAQPLHFVVITIQLSTSVSVAF